MSSFKKSSAGIYDVGTEGLNFKDEDDGETSPTGITILNSSAYIVGGIKNHFKVLYHYEIPDVQATIYITLSDQGSGTLEFYMYMKAYPAAGHYFYYAFKDGGYAGTLRFQLRITQAGQIQVSDGNGSGASGYTGIKTLSLNTWYHFSIRFRGDSAGAYQGLANDEYKVFIDGTEYGDYHYHLDGDNVDTFTTQPDDFGGSAQMYLDAFAWDWDAGYDIGDNLTIAPTQSLSRTDLNKFLITHEIFKPPFAGVEMSEEEDIFSGMILQCTDNYSVDGATASNIIFEGKVIAIDKTYPYKATCYNRAFEMYKLFPSGSQTNDSDGILNAIVGADNDYIVAGDLTDGADMGTLTYGGDKDQSIVFRNLAFFEGWLFYFKEAVEDTSIKIDFNPGTTSTGISIDTTDNIWDVKLGRAGRYYTKVVVNGASGYTGSATASAEDIANYGTNVFYHRDASLNTNALCATAATNILEVLDNDPYLLHLKYQDASIGYMQPGQTFTFEYDLDGVDEVTSQTFIINKIVYDALSGVGEVWASSSITYDYKTLNFISQQLPQENSALISAQETTISTYLNNNIPPLHQTFQDGYTTNYYGLAYVANSDTDAKWGFSFYIPETRADWKLRFIFANDNAETGSGKIYLGATGDGEGLDTTSLFNGDNFDLTTSAGNVKTYKVTSAFSATAGDTIRGRWQKDADEGAGSMYNIGVILYY